MKKHALEFGFFCCWGCFGFGVFFPSAIYIPSAGTYPGWLSEVEEDVCYLVIFKVDFVGFGADTTLYFFFF